MDEETFWRRQNLWIGVLAPITTAILVAGILAFVQGSNNAGFGLCAGGLVGSVVTGWLIMKKDSHPNGYAAFVTAVTLVGLTWVFLICDVYLRLNASQSPVFLGWGGGTAGTCTVVVDGTQLKQWQEKGRLIMACGLPDPGLDRMRDDHIAISGLFTIIPETITISTPLNPVMVAEVRQRNAKGLAEVHGQSIVISFQVWFEVAVIPNTCDVSTIRTLYDIGRCGGTSIGGRGGEATINANAN